ncbi:hypothetical protein GWA97_06470 [Flavobacterium sp. LaA7.5]|nr:hypothetical protein [Flavobacterium salilacus subsp. altitudinum]
MKAKLYKLFKFSIDEELDKYEFNLEYLSSIITDNNLGFETYRYEKKDINTFLGYNVKEVLLSYNADLLAGVTYFLQTKKFIKVLSLVFPYMADTESKHYAWVKPNIRHRCITSKGIIVDITLIEGETVVMLTHTKYELNCTHILGSNRGQTF